MRIIRFLSDDNNIYLGEENKDFQNVANIVQGNIFDVNTLKKTGKSRYIVKLLSPLIPKDIFCVGLNYMKHYEELSKKKGIKLPGRPVIFMKSTSSLNYHNNTIAIPNVGKYPEEVDYEVELAVVIGKPALNVAAEDALDYVAGYTVANDVSQRYWQNNAGAGQWITGKSFDGFAPLGKLYIYYIFYTYKPL